MSSDPIETVPLEFTVYPSAYRARRREPVATFEDRWDAEGWVGRRINAIEYVVEHDGNFRGVAQVTNHGRAILDTIERNMDL